MASSRRQAGPAAMAGRPSFATPMATSSYNHQSAFAKGVTVGARVRQGQVIGYIGTSGLSTGPHLHYELIVNGAKVDPMRVRLPVGRVLKGEEMARFKEERDRIDALLKEDPNGTLKVASAKVSG